MANNLKKVFKSLTDQINKSPVLSNSSAVIGSTIDVAQEKVSHLRNLTSDKFENITKVFTYLIIYRSHQQFVINSKHLGF